MAAKGVQQMQKASQLHQKSKPLIKSRIARCGRTSEEQQMEAQNNAMIQHQLAQTEWAKKFAEESMQAQLEIAQQQAMLQLQLTLLR